jgi:hypothetical protein
MMAAQLTALSSAGGGGRRTLRPQAKVSGGLKSAGSSDSVTGR